MYKDVICIKRTTTEEKKTELLGVKFLILKLIIIIQIRLL